MIDPPNTPERTLVARVLMEEGELIGSVDEIWTHSLAWRTLATLRLCVDAISALHKTGFSVQASFIKAYVLQGGDGVPFLLDGMAEFLVKDADARRYWDAQVPDDHWPVKCPFCNSAAYIGYLSVSCKSRCPESKTR